MKDVSKWLAGYSKSEEARVLLPQTLRDCLLRAEQVEDVQWSVEVLELLTRASHDWDYFLWLLRERRTDDLLTTIDVALGLDARGRIRQSFSVDFMVDESEDTVLFDKEEHERNRHEFVQPEPRFGDPRGSAGLWTQLPENSRGSTQLSAAPGEGEWLRKLDRLAGVIRAYENGLKQVGYMPDEMQARCLAALVLNADLPPEETLMQRARDEIRAKGLPMLQVTGPHKQFAEVRDITIGDHFVIASDATVVAYRDSKGFRDPDARVVRYDWLENKELEAICSKAWVCAISHDGCKVLLQDKDTWTVWEHGGLRKLESLADRAYRFIAASPDLSCALFKHGNGQGDVVDLSKDKKVREIAQGVIGSGCRRVGRSSG